MIHSSSRTFGSRTTAEEALDNVSLSGKTAIVTGASSGIGVETARVLGLAGARVVMACRSRITGEDVAKDLRARASGGSFEVEPLDLTDLANVRAFAERYVASGRPLHLLVNNAGVMATPLSTTTQGIELQVGTNHVGHFLLTKLLRPVIEASAPSRIVTVSSSFYRWGRFSRLVETLESDPGYSRRKYRPFEAYGDSKLANVLFARHLANTLPSSVKSFSVHPGVIKTRLTRSMGVSGALFRTFGQFFMKSVPQGAATTIFAATSPTLENLSGAYLANCDVTRTSASGSNVDYATRLWELTERVVANFAEPIPVRAARSLEQN